MATNPLTLALDPYYLWLRERVLLLEGQLQQFETKMTTLQQDYQRSLTFHLDLDKKSSLMESYTVNMNRQWKSVEKMTTLYQQALDELKAVEATC